MKDYIAICSCNNFEHYSSKLGDVKTWSKDHIEKNPSHEIYIDRNRDLEIDDTFKSIVIKK